MAVPMPPSKKHKLKKQTIADHDSTHDELISPLPVLKGILIKPSSPIRLYQSNSSVTVSTVALVAGSTTLQSSSVSINCKPVSKKVRFSISRPKNSVLQARFSSLQPQPLAADLASKESDLLDSHLEPVTETIFFTHSRFSYDRSPIAVDKALNKSLDLPPRNPMNTFSPGRWLPQSRSTDYCEREQIPSHTLTESKRTNATIPSMPHSITTYSIAHGLAVATHHVEERERCHPKSLPSGCDSKDSSNDSNLLFTNPNACATWMEEFITRQSSLHLNPNEALPLMNDQHLQISKSSDNVSIVDEHLTCHLFNNSKIEETLDATEHCQVDEMVGIGNWTRAQVFGSWDALAGF